MKYSTPLTMGNQGNRGFTLIELMIVVVIVGILAAIAYPSYRNQVIKGNRSAAKSYLLALAAREEQYMLDARSYAGTVAALNLSVPAEVSSFYAVTIKAPAGPPPTYTITATPAAGTMQVNDGWIALNSSGQKTSEYPGKW